MGLTMGFFPSGRVKPPIAQYGRTLSPAKEMMAGIKSTRKSSRFISENDAQC
jgi:hypothetical protein